MLFRGAPGEVPPTPADLEPPLQPGEGYTVRAVCWRRGMVLELDGPDSAALIHPVLETEDGRPVVLRGASGGGGQTMVTAEALPADVRAIRRRDLEVQRQVRGPWVLPFRVPG